MSLLIAHNITHADATNSEAKMEKVKQPTISSAGTHDKWANFSGGPNMCQQQNNWAVRCNTNDVTVMDWYEMIWIEMYVFILCLLV